MGPAAFRRLCVETAAVSGAGGGVGPAAFRRLCVETDWLEREDGSLQPAAFRRLCVETDINLAVKAFDEPSRLQAAVC